ncbi:MAG: GDSL-type esterase/lipase family protein [Elstera sp.]
MRVPRLRRFLSLTLSLGLAACAGGPSTPQKAAGEAAGSPVAARWHMPETRSAASLPKPSPRPRQGSGPLAGFFTELAALERGERQEPLLILQLGDSHTAGDRFSGRLRERLQAQFGASGRGALPPAVPFDYFRPQGVQITASPGWIISRAGAAKPEGLFGVSGFRARATKPGDRAMLTSTEEAGFDTLLLTVLRQPLGGTLELEIDGQRLPAISTAAETGPQVARLSIPVPPGSRQAILTARADGPTDLLAWGSLRQKPGVVLEAHGTVGATIKLLRRFDATTLAFELTDRRPDLILLAFGTNEGFQDGWTADGYSAEAAAALADLRRAAPGIDIAVIGPPDGNRLATSGCSPAATRQCLAPGQPVPPQPAVKPGARKPVAACRWAIPPNLGMVRQTLSSLAVREKLFFWDWSQVMGACGANAWALQDPPLAGQDRVHYRPEGYARAADALYDQLMADFAVWKQSAGAVAQR